MDNMWEYQNIFGQKNLIGNKNILIIKCELKTLNNYRPL